jgi:hypothetical protein
MKKEYLRKIIRECIKDILSESVDVNVVGARNEGYYDDTDILSLTYSIYRHITEIWQSFPKDVQDKNRMFLEPDGNDYDKYTGTINFYSHNWPRQALKPTLVAIQQYFKDNDIEYGDFKSDISRMTKKEVIRIPIINSKNDYEKAPELNMANGNAYKLFSDILRIPEYGDDGLSISIKELEFRLNELGDNQKELNQNLNSFTSPAHSEENHYFAGTNMGQLGRYIVKLKEIIEWAKSKGYTQISVG